MQCNKNNELMYKYLRAKSKLCSVVEILSIYPGDIRSRLRCAFSDIDSIVEDDLPDEFVGDWKYIKRELTKFGPKFNSYGAVCVGSVEHTMNRIKNSTGTKIADRIYYIYYELNFNEIYN